MWWLGDGGKDPEGCWFVTSPRTRLPAHTARNEESPPEFPKIGDQKYKLTYVLRYVVRISWETVPGGGERGGAGAVAQL